MARKMDLKCNRKTPTIGQNGTRFQALGPRTDRTKNCSWNYFRPLCNGRKSSIQWGMENVLIANWSLNQCRHKRIYPFYGNSPFSLLHASALETTRANPPKRQMSSDLFKWIYCTQTHQFLSYLLLLKNCNFVKVE